MLIEPAYASDEPGVRGIIRYRPEDFFVAEIPSVDPTGEGEHVLLHIEKRGINTAWLADQLAHFAGVPKRDVSFAGLKDRQAVTRQWFSVGLAGKPEPDWSGMRLEGVTVLQHTRHRRKLRRGALQGNRFNILIRDLQGDLNGLESRLARVERQGVPNYFGEQRFGREGRNLEQAMAMFKGRRVRDRNQRSLYLSSVRSFLFNELLSRRVRVGDWNQPIDGDVMLLEGSNSYFVIDEVTEEIRRRCHEGDIHPGGCLWGQGDSPARHRAAILEQTLPTTQPELCRGLEQAGLELAYRPLRLVPGDFQWKLDTEQGQLELEFRLPAGAYATTVLRELVSTDVSA